MTTPDGFRMESARTPDASRAGALHSHSHSHSHMTVVELPSMTSGRGRSRGHHQADPASVMDGAFGDSAGGAR